ncbi:MAG: ABC transporter permease [Defluviitaleaceae bacterium]|nr:ABC transporter permease [Defluviitaleaceae bacterium]
MTIFKFALRRGLFSPVAIILNGVIPAALIVMMRLNDDGDYRQGIFLIAMAVMFGGFFMAKGVQNDRMEGVLLRILCGPVTTRTYLWQNLLGAAVPMVGLTALISAIGHVVLNWETTFTLGIFLTYTFLAMSSVGLSFVWSSLFKSKEASSGAFGAVMTLISALSGFMIPLHLMPDFLFYTGALFPAHWASRAMQIMLDYGEFSQMFWLSMLAMFLFTVAFILFGAKRRLI